jgi:membrane protease YdiL (CAAX protease family)
MPSYMLQDEKTLNWKYTLGRIVVFCLACAMVLVLGSPLTASLGKPWSDVVLAAVAIPIVFALTLLFVRWEGLRLRDVGVVPGRKTLSRVLLGFVIGLFLAGLHAALVLAYEHQKPIRVPGQSFALVLVNLLLYSMVAIREELAFRGYPLRSLTYAIGAWKSQIIIAIIFSLEHAAGGYTWTQAFFGAGVGAILFGVAALKSKGLALPIGIHTAWNFGQWCIGFKSERGIWQVIIPKEYELKHEQVSMICYLIVMGLAIGAFYFYRNSKEYSAYG